MISKLVSAVTLRSVSQKRQSALQTMQYTSLPYHNTDTGKIVTPPEAKGRNEEWASAIATINFQPNQVVGIAHGVFHNKPTRYTIQVGSDKHVEFHGGLEYVNHSCSPNTRIELVESTADIAFIASKSIRDGENLTFDYASSEWDMDEKFECNCGSANCRGFIGGAKYLSDNEIKSQMHLFTPQMLRYLLEQRLR